MAVRLVESSRHLPLQFKRSQQHLSGRQYRPFSTGIKRFKTAEMATQSTHDAGQSGQHSLAILDDYASIASKHFQNISGLEKVSSYPETLNPSTSLQAQIDRLQPYTIISSMRERSPFPKELLAKLPNLQLLLTTGMRNASIDLEAAKEQNIIVAGTTGKPASPSSTAATDGGEDSSEQDAPPPSDYPSTNQQAWALLLSLCSRIPTDHAALTTNPATEAWQSGLAIPLGGKQLSLLGFGKLGAQMARTALLGFGMRAPILAWSENLTQESADSRAVEVGLQKGDVVVPAGEKEELLRRADVLSLHYVLSERSRGILGRRELELMKRSALLVNTSRGGLIDEEALLDVLRAGGIRGCALDVFWEEPLGAESPWRQAGRKAGEGGFKSEVVLSPHMGYVNAGTMELWYREQAAIVREFVKGGEVGNRMN